MTRTQTRPPRKRLLFSSFPMTRRSRYFHSRWRPLSLHSAAGDASQWLLTHLSPSCHRVNASRALPFPQTFIWMAQSPRRGRLLSSACEWSEWLFLIRSYYLQHKRWLFCTSCSVQRPRNTDNQRSPELKCPKGQTVNEKQSIHRDWQRNPIDFRVEKSK